MAKYQVQTTNGTFEIETEEATGPDMAELQAEDKPLQPEGPFEAAAGVLRVGDRGMRAAGALAATGGDLDQAAQIAQNQPATTTAGKVGSTIGQLVGPSSLAIQAALGPVAKLAGEALPAVKSALGIGQAGEKELLAAKSALKELPIKYAQKEAALTELGGQAGKEIEAAQSARGIGMVKKGIPEVPKDLNSFANSMRGVAQKSPDDLAKALDLEGLQGLKDTITVARQSGKLSPAQAAMVNKAAEKIDAAVAKVAPDIGEGLSKFRNVADAKEALAGEQMVEKMRLQKAIDKIRADKRMSASTKVAKMRELLVKGAKTAGGGALAAMGWHQGSKFLH